MLNYLIQKFSIIWIISYWRSQRCDESAAWPPILVNPLTGVLLSNPSVPLPCIILKWCTLIHGKNILPAKSTSKAKISWYKVRSLWVSLYAAQREQDWCQQSPPAGAQVGVHTSTPLPSHAAQWGGGTAQREPWDKGSTTRKIAEQHLPPYGSCAHFPEDQIPSSWVLSHKLVCR